MTGALPFLPLAGCVITEAGILGLATAMTGSYGDSSREAEGLGDVAGLGEPFVLASGDAGGKSGFCSFTGDANAILLAAC